jgi:hypothetical protein
MIDLPSTPEPQSAVPYFLDQGGWQTPANGGGNAIRLDRLGDRHGITVRMPPMKLNDPAGLAHARVWIQRLKRGMSEGVRMKFPQPDFVIPLSTLITGTAAAQATLVPFTGGSAVTIPEGIFCTLWDTATAQGYLHSVHTQLVVGGGGTGTLSLHPRLRRAFAAPDEIRFNPPTIEGRLIGEERNWNLEMSRTVGLEFQIEEIA